MSLPKLSGFFKVCFAEDITRLANRVGADEASRNVFSVPSAVCGVPGMEEVLFAVLRPTGKARLRAGPTMLRVNFPFTLRIFLFF